MRLLLTALLLLPGCTAVADYLRFRGLDLMDCVKLNAGVGVGLAVDARVTDWFAPGLGYLSYTVNWGWDDRRVNGVWKEWVVINTPREVIESVIGEPSTRESPDYDPGQRVGRLALASVFLANERWIRDPETGEVTVEYYSLFNFSPVSSYLRQADPHRFFLRDGETPIVRRKPLFDQGWIEVGATALLLHARAGVNLFQAFDFAAGLFGWDPAHDDRRKVRAVPDRPPFWVGERRWSR